MNTRTVGTLDPRLVAGPRTAVSTVRPVVSEQRVLLLDGGRPEMFDLVTGEIRPWENGPPITIPCGSVPFQLADYSHLHVQLFRDLRTASTDRALVSLVVGSDEVLVSESVEKSLILAGPQQMADGPIGESPAVVVSFEPTPTDEGLSVVISARNAEGQESCTITEMMPTELATLTIGGPSTMLGGPSGRRRPSAVHIHAQRRVGAASFVKRVASRARREASSILDRRG